MYSCTVLEVRSPRSVLLGESGVAGLVVCGGSNGEGFLFFSTFWKLPAFLGLTTLPPQCVSAVFGSIVTSAFPSLIPPPPSSKDPYSVRSTWITQDNLPLSRLILLIPSVESASPGKVTWVTGSGVVMWASLEGCVALPATDIYVTRGNNTCHLLFGGLS